MNKFPITMQQLTKKQIAARKRSIDPKYLKKRSSATKKSWQNIEHRAKRIAAMKKAAKKRWAEPGYREKYKKEAGLKISTELVERWKDPEYKKNTSKSISQTMKKTCNTPEFLAKRSKLSKEMWQDPEYADKVSKAVSAELVERWKNPKYVAKMSAIRKLMWQDPEFRARVIPLIVASSAPRFKDPKYLQQMSNVAKRSWQNPKYRKKVMDATWNDPEYVERMKVTLKEVFNDPEYVKRISEMHTKQWQDPIYRETQIKAILKGLIQRPTSLEKQMIAIIERNNLPYRYTGDGDVLIGYKNPDFVHTGSEKICVEVANIYHHAEDYPEKRIAHFKKYGWKCVVFRTNDLNENEILTTLGDLN